MSRWEVFMYYFVALSLLFMTSGSPICGWIGWIRYLKGTGSGAGWQLAPQLMAVDWAHLPGIMTWMQVGWSWNWSLTSSYGGNWRRDRVIGDRLLWIMGLIGKGGISSLVMQNRTWMERSCGNRRRDYAGWWETRRLNLGVNIPLANNKRNKQTNRKEERTGRVLTCKRSRK